MSYSDIWRNIRRHLTTASLSRGDKMPLPNFNGFHGRSVNVTIVLDAASKGLRSFILFRIVSYSLSLSLSLPPLSLAHSLSRSLSLSLPFFLCLCVCM